MRLFLLQQEQKKLLELVGDLNRLLKNTPVPGLDAKRQKLINQLKILQREKLHFVKNIKKAGLGRNLASLLPNTKASLERLKFATELNKSLALANDLLRACNAHYKRTANVIATNDTKYYLKKYFPSTSKSTLLTVAAAFCLMVVLTLLGALAEDNPMIQSVLNLFMLKTLVFVFVFIASKLPAILLIKCSLFSTWFFSLFADAITHPGDLTKLFGFTDKAIFLKQDSTFKTNLFAEVANIKNALVSREKSRLILNPFFWIVLALAFVKTFLLFAIDKLATVFGKTTNVTSCQRILKGLALLALELPNIFFKLLANIWIRLYNLMDAIFTGIEKSLSFLVAISHQPTTVGASNNQNNLSAGQAPTNTASSHIYITQKLFDRFG